MVEAVPLAAAGKSDGGAGSTTESVSSDGLGTHGVYDPLMNILITSRVALRSNGEWRLEAEPPHCYEDCDKRIRDNVIEEPIKTNRNNSGGKNITRESSSSKTDRDSTTTKSYEKKKKSTGVDCGKPVNTTVFDHLRGIINRNTHPHIPEPEVAMIFRSKSNPDVDMTMLQNQLRKTKKEKPKSSQVYNQIGNYWRIKGDTTRSVECFRKSLYLAPNNSDALLNLARVLFNLQYLDDAYELTRASLDAQPPDQNAWLQHFTLGEILKARMQYRDAEEHFRRTLDLHPGFHPAQSHLQEMESSSDGGGMGGASLTYYTLFIILLLVLGVLCGILSSIDGGFDDIGEAVKTQRHFNRAMAMRSIKLGINPKLIRMRKQYGC